MENLLATFFVIFLWRQHDTDKKKKDSIYETKITWDEHISDK